MIDLITPLTIFYASLYVLFNMVLLAMVIKNRRAQQVSLGTGENNDLQSAIRAHGNFIENIPFLLILLFLAELNGMPPYLLHGLGVAILLGRIAHAYSVHVAEKQRPPIFAWRVRGMMLTFGSYALLAAIGMYAVIAAVFFQG